MQVERASIAQFVEDNIGPLFHDRRLDSLRELSLSNILKRKNPYLFKAKNLISAEELVRGILDAYLSSQEETIFGNFLEELAVFACGRAYSGMKSSTEGIDLDFSRGEVRYLVTIKSGPNWGNSSQIARMRDNFRRMRTVLKANSSIKQIVCVNGCCYGKGNSDVGDYIKICGQAFWELISGDNSLYIDLVEPLGREAKAKNEAFNIKYHEVINRFTLEFLSKFSVDGRINWPSLIRYTSEATQK